MKNLRKSPPGDDFYPTPRRAITSLLKYESFDGMIWEPACGDGAISRVLESPQYSNGAAVLSTDLIDRGYGIPGVDFLKQTGRVSNIITNPPFSLANEFTQHCLKLCDHKLALLLRLAYLEGIERYDSIFTVNPPARVRVFSRRIHFEKNRVIDHKGRSAMAFAWFIWDTSHTGATELSWLSPHDQEISNQSLTGC